MVKVTEYSNNVSKMLMPRNQNFSFIMFLAYTLNVISEKLLCIWHGYKDGLPALSGLICICVKLIYITMLVPSELWKL
jgi:hypothetical protein